MTTGYFGNKDIPVFSHTPICVVDCTLRRWLSGAETPLRRRRDAEEGNKCRDAKEGK
jgi:hypothetical protein